MSAAPGIRQQTRVLQTRAPVPRGFASRIPRVSQEALGAQQARMAAFRPTQAVSDAMMEAYDAKTLSDQQLVSILARPRIDFTSILDTVRAVDGIRMMFVTWKGCTDSIGVIWQRR